MKSTQSPEAGYELGTFVIAGGWGESHRCFQRLAYDLASANYGALCLASPRFGGQRRDLARGRYPLPQLRLARSVNRQLDEAGAGKVIALAHSMGGIYTIIAAMLRPDQFEAIVLLAPSGLEEHDSFLSLASRLGKKVIHSLVVAWYSPIRRRATWLGIREGLRYGLANPVRAIQEARSVPRCFTLSWIAWLRERGVKVYLLRASDDLIYPPIAEPSLTEKFDGSVVMNGAQHDVWFYPTELTQAILSLIGSAAAAPGGVSQ